MWLDNFSKFYSVAMQSVAKGAFSECLWTGRGMHEVVGPNVDTRMYGKRAMPLSIFDSKSSSATNAKLVSCDKENRFYWHDSLVKRFNVNNIPLKPVVSAATDSKLAALLAEKRDGLRNFFPMEVLPLNIGSNRGLLLILKQLFTQQRKPGHFSFLTVDCNIFLRVLKVI